MDLREADPKGLIREAYVIEGITVWECRSIFVDWALSLPQGADLAPRVDVLLAAYATGTHPMDAVLKEGARPLPSPTRRGGRSGRVGPSGSDA